MTNSTTPLAIQEMCQKAERLGMNPERLLRLDRTMREWVYERKIIQALVLHVTRHGEDAFSAAYGKNGLHEELGDMTPDIIFPMASVSKCVVATLMCILQEEGKLELGQPVRKFLPELTGDTRSEIRLWHLLTHTSGYEDKDVHTFVEQYLTANAIKPEEITEGEYRRIQMAAPPTHRPHTVMSYCSFGFNLAADVMERVTQKSLDQLATEYLFEPLGMTDSHYRLPPEKYPRRMIRAAHNNLAEWLNDSAFESQSGAGGLKSTAPDMCRFVNLFLQEGKFNGKRLLSKPSVRMMLRDHNKGLPDAWWGGETFLPNWGMGWNLHGDKVDDAGFLQSPRAFHHGGTGGIKVLGDPEYDMAMAILYTHSNEIQQTDWNWHNTHIINMIFGCIEE